MANKPTKKILSTFINQQDTEITASFRCAESDFEIRLKTTLSPAAFYAFVDRVAGNCFDVKSGEYVAAYHNIFFKIAVLQLLTDCPTPTIGKERVDIEKAVALVDALGLVNGALEAQYESYSRLLNELRAAVDEQIRYEIKQRPSVSDKACMRIIDVCDNVNAILNNFNDVQSSETLQTLKGIVDQGITADGIVDAFLKKRTEDSRPDIHGNIIPLPVKSLNNDEDV